VGSVGTFFPLVLGFAMCYVFPDVIGATAKDRFATALFMGSLLSLSANPVISGILMDMGLFKSEIGRTIMAATSPTPPSRRSSSCRWRRRPTTRG
jgi:Kef-type K+ transport system membrane component KefB